MSSIADYLAKKYLSSDDKKKKKKKRVKRPENATTFIYDDEISFQKKSIDDSIKEEEKERIANMKKDIQPEVNVMDKFKKQDESSWISINDGIDENTKKNNEKDKIGIDKSPSPSLSPPRKSRRIYSDNEDEQIKQGRQSRSYSRSRSRSRSISRSSSGSPPRRRKRVYSDDEEEENEVKPSRRHDSYSRSRSRSVSSSRERSQGKRRVYSDDESDNEKDRKKGSERLNKTTKNNQNKDIPKMSDGSLAGLQAGKSLKLEAKRKKQMQDEILAKMNPEESGKSAKTIYRDKYGKKVDLSVERARLAKEQRKKEEEEQKDMVWGKGLVQQREREEMAKQLLLEKSRPMARYKDDVELNQEQMEIDRWGDPMAGLVKKKKKSVAIYGQTSATAVRPKYKGPLPPPNRFNIEPGYRWDGIDRSNGFENKYFQALNKKESTQEAAYKWSTEDM